MAARRAEGDRGSESGIPFLKNIGERIELTAGENVTGIKVVMVVNGSGSVLGQVAVVNGVLRPDLQLLVFTRRLGETSTVGLSPAQVDARGKFVIEGLMPGEYEFRLFSLTRTGMPGAGLRLPEAQKITVGSGETHVTFTLDLGEK